MQGFSEVIKVTPTKSQTPNSAKGNEYGEVSTQMYQNFKAMGIEGGKRQDGGHGGRGRSPIQKQIAKTEQPQMTLTNHNIPKFNIPRPANNAG